MDHTPPPKPSRPPIGREHMTAPEIGAVLRRYELGRVVSVRELRAGDAGAPKALVESARGTLLLKRRSRACDDPYMVAFQHGLQLHLESRGYPVAPLLGTRDENNSMVQLDGRVYELFRYIDARPADGTTASAEIAGGALARLHELSEGYRSSWTAPEDRASALERVGRRLARLQTRHPGLAPACARLRALSEWAHHAMGKTGLDRCAVRVVHGDWHPGNTLIRDGRLLGVIDFDAARRAELGVELAQALVQFSLAPGGADPGAWSDEPEMPRLLALWRGYRRGGGGADGLWRAIPLLMVETLVKEAASGIDPDGNAGRRPGGAFLGAVARKGEWLETNAERVARELSGIDA